MRVIKATLNKCRRRGAGLNMLQKAATVSAASAMVAPARPQAQRPLCVSYLRIGKLPALPSGATAQQVNAAMEGHVLREGRITGLYTRD